MAADLETIYAKITIDNETPKVQAETNKGGGVNSFTQLSRQSVFDAIPESRKSVHNETQPKPEAIKPNEEPNETTIEITDPAQIKEKLRNLNLSDTIVINDTKETTMYIISPPNNEGILEYIETNNKTPFDPSGANALQMFRRKAYLDQLIVNANNPKFYSKIVTTSR